MPTLETNFPTLKSIRLWDPEIAVPTVQKQQNKQTYYQIPTLDTDRYDIGNTLTPAMVGVRQVDSSNLPAASQTWVNTHLVYTHGEGMVTAPSNQVNGSGLPNYGIGGVPPTSTGGWPKITQPGVYFGLDQQGWVVADTKSPEIDYQTTNGSNATSHYSGSGGVQLTSFLKRAAFAIRLADFNLLVSSQITSDSRIMFVRDIKAMAQKAAPFLTYDNDPYPVLVNGHVDWVLNAYTTTSEYPYSENANSFEVPSGSSLGGGTNYVRNSVAVVVNSYSGKMTFYALDTTDPILRSYEASFPSMFVSKSQMPATLLAHLRFPPDLFSLQTAVYGRYRITNPSTFYGYTDSWSISPTAGVGSPSQALQVVRERNAQGQLVTGPVERMSPLYQVQQLPGSSQLTFAATEAYVPTSPNDSIQTLSGFVVASSDSATYGKLSVYRVQSQSINGPALVDSDIQANSKVSGQITLLNQNGSTVLFGNVLMVPIDQSMLYVRPVYVTSNRNPFPVLQFVIADFNSNISMQPTLDAALSDVLGVQVSGTAGSGSSSSTSKGTGSSGLSNSELEQVRSFLSHGEPRLPAGAD